MQAGQQVADHLREYEDRCLWRYLWSPHPRGAACNGNLRLRVDFVRCYDAGSSCRTR